MDMDYTQLGFKCGVEIHQQLDTTKLFCSCPSIAHDTNPDIIVKRQLRAVAGESGSVDKAASFEKSKQKEFIYEACSSSCCLVELDEEPIHECNKDALDTAILFAKLCNANIVDEIQFMRKTVIDGSNVSGFQRTALVATDGFIDTSKGRVMIPSICLEEEAAKKVEATKEYTKYRLDRLGIPLIEAGTDPTIKDPEHAKEVAEKLGLMLRSIDNVKRGIGTIRQDVNISIKGGARTEIKGFQELKSIPKVITNEIKRQQHELSTNKKIEPQVRKANSDFSTTFLRPMPGADRMYPETDIKTIKLSQKHVDSLKTPELIGDQVKSLVSLGIKEDLAKSIAKSGKKRYFASLFKKLKNLKPSFIIESFNILSSELKKEIGKNIKDSEIEKALFLVSEQKIPKNLLKECLKDIVEGKLNMSKYSTASQEDLEKEVARIVKEKPGLTQGGYMGLIMAKFKGKADGKKVALILKNLI